MQGIYNTSKLEFTVKTVICFLPRIAHSAHVLSVHLDQNLLVHFPIQFWDSIPLAAYIQPTQAFFHFQQNRFAIQIKTKTSLIHEEKFNIIYAIMVYSL